MLENIIQGSEEWHIWRNAGIGGSDVPAIMNESEYNTPLDIWKLKTGRKKRADSNFVQQRGTESEPRVRALYALEHDLDVPPRLFQHPNIEWARVSLDGYSNLNGGTVLEIKYVGKERHEQAKNKILPACYIGQVQYQLLVTGARRAHYVSFNGESIEVIEVFPDLSYWDRMLPILTDFWDYVVRDVAPPLTSRDFLDLDDAESVKVFQEWKDAKLFAMQLESATGFSKSVVSEAKKRLEAARISVETRMSHPKILCNGVKAMMVSRKNGPSLDVRFQEAVS